MLLVQAAELMQNNQLKLHSYKPHLMCTKCNVHVRNEMISCALDRYAKWVVMQLYPCTHANCHMLCLHILMRGTAVVSLDNY